MLQEEVVGVASQTQDGIPQSGMPEHLAELGLSPLPDFQAMYDQIVYERVEESAKGPSPQSYEQVHAQIQAELEADIAQEEAEAAACRQESDTPIEPADPQVRYVVQAELDAEQAKLYGLSEKAKAGDSQALDQLRQELDNCPHVWRRLGDLQLLIEEEMASQVGPKDLLFLEAYRKRAAEIRHQLLDDSQDLLTQMAVSRVVDCWLFTQFLQLQVLQEKHPKDGVKQLAQAERRLESAVRTLSLAKKLQKHLATA